jgi:hypothetical protein
MSDGTTRLGNVSVHPDPRVQAVVEQSREAEMIQAIDRLRLIHNQKRKTVYILCSIPLDLAVDELVTWAQLTGDRRLTDALAECDERGWDALPLAAKQLHRLFPKLWGTETAAKRWLEKDPLKPHRDIIRVWGVLNDYRPPSQTRWSRAVVRHRIDPRTALAGVLGIAAGDIQVRPPAGGGSGQSLRVKANTAPMPRPRNPIPNTEPMALPSNGEPGFPSGDN